MRELIPYIGLAGAVISFFTAIIVALLAFIARFILNSYEKRLNDLETKTEEAAAHRAQAIADRHTIERLESAVSALQTVVSDLKIQLAQFYKPTSKS